MAWLKCAAALLLAVPIPLRVGGSQRQNHRSTEGQGELGAARPRPWGPGAAPAADNKPGRRRAAFATGAVRPGPGRKTPQRSRAGSGLSL